MNPSSNFLRDLLGGVSRKVSPDPKQIFFLHIGKCAGTQIGDVIKKINETKGNVLHKCFHDDALKDIPVEADYFFSIREPISRFYSGFYSRKRKGQPRMFFEWTEHEAFAFQEFEHANDLAESLFEDSHIGSKAMQAITSIRHTAQNQIDWFFMCGGIFDVRPPLAIIRQENFASDLSKFLERAGLTELQNEFDFSKGKKKAHANDYSATPPLSDKAKTNLQHWYSQDIEFYRVCERWIEKNM
ncbi:sulfotransferase family 2 domain-containing protein [Cognatishimia activa]|uniref:Sulfotransferase family protein n=1 Tax=Cognatishimia activa TaxID=1715691 RepID=A0A0P1IVT9_9RHOB|nr:sulfotransferase family 2 domain-containing protein [Cognatishimia activa]CUJ18663.1 hypothetical protein TA5113_02573 [Cognatishimia activa]CUK27606.1 hypothetical protein TA5114_03434 [Cognatishimia activa]